MRLLAVGDLQVRFRAPARYDDLVRIRCWVRELASLFLPLSPDDRTVNMVMVCTDYVMP